jgi:hypothetical protein
MYVFYHALEEEAAMELKDFVAEALVQIQEGCRKQ